MLNSCALRTAVNNNCSALVGYLVTMPNANFEDSDALIIAINHYNTAIANVLIDSMYGRVLCTILAYLAALESNGHELAARIAHVGQLDIHIHIHIHN